MQDPRHPQAPRPMPTPARSGNMVDPLVATSNSVNAQRPTQGQDRIKLDDDEPIQLVDLDDAPAAPGASPGATKSGSVAGLKPGESVSGRKIVAFGGDAVKQLENFKRIPNKSGQGAIRVKSFHGKYSDEGLKYLDNAINTWLDDHPEIEVKFVTPTVMTFEGKIREPALVLNVWY
jgi:hypothetical protein